MREAIIVGNWKMNKNNAETQAFFEEVEPAAVSDKALYGIGAPFTDLKTALDNAKNLIVAAENVHFEDSGAFTGEVSVPMLEELVSQYSPQAQEKGLFLSLKQQDPENETANPAAVFDEKWTMEAIANLIDNAIKYTERGNITLSVSSYEMFLCIQVTDTGIGIPEQEYSKIFSRFYRSEAVHEKPGVGIGLFLAREVIMLENGYIKVSSRPGKGSVFSVYLPL